MSGPDPSEDLQSSAELEEKANDSAAAEGFNGSAKGADEGEIVGVIINGIDAIFKFGSMVVLLPVELQRMGFPYYVAYPGGLLVQIIASIGLVQFATNRNWV